MESGIWGRVKTAIVVYSAGTAHPSSKGGGRTHSNSPSTGKSDTLYKSVCLLFLLWFDSRRERSGADGFDVGVKTKIMIFR